VCADGGIVTCGAGFALAEHPCAKECVTFDGGIALCME
jgi:hypothetical protein